MFNKEKIRTLEARVAFLEESRERVWVAIQSLSADSEKLAAHLGFKFENVNERQFVAIKTSEKFKK